MAFNFLKSLVDNDLSDPNDSSDDSDNESDFQPEQNDDDSGSESDDSDTTSTTRSVVDLDLPSPQRQPNFDNNQIPWSRTLSDVNVSAFEGASGPNHDLSFQDRPIDFFHLYIPELHFKKVQFETNKYAKLRQAASGKKDELWREVTVKDIKCFLYINLMFGIHQVPQIDAYWSTDQLLRVSSIADVMSRDRYYRINKYFHVNDSATFKPRGILGHDPIHKIRPLYDNVVENSKNLFTPSCAVSFDEAMVAFKGRLYFKQYIRGKPTPWGVKVWCAADPITGYLLNFSFYTGKNDTPDPNGLGYSVVMGLGEPYLNSNRQFYFDNFFTSVKLAEDLLSQDTYMCGTIRTNRKNWPKDFKMNKTDVLKMKQDGNMVATCWKDKRVVNILSTNSNPAFGTAARRTKDGVVNKDIPIPVLNYNKNMGGVDLNDQKRSYYPIGRKSKKWWRCAHWYLYEVAVVNAYILYQHTTPVPQREKHMTLLQFHLEIARDLLRGNICRQRRSKEFPSTSGLGKADPKDHRSVRLYGRKRGCFQCRIEGKKTASNHVPETVYGCPTCNTHLCKGLCFAKFHNNLN